MIIKNPEKLLKRFIPNNTDLWYVRDLSVTMDDSGISYIYKMSTDIPVKSSPQQQYYHMTRAIEQEVILRLIGPTYELYCNGCILHGYCKDIDTLDKFINQITNILPKY
jgi:hypothetical protein